MDLPWKQPKKYEVRSGINSVCHLALASARTVSSAKSYWMYTQKKQGIAECTYEEVPKKLWPVPLREIWGIGSRMEKHLNNMGMYTLGDVANSSLDRLRKRFGVIGEQLYYHAWGIDLSPPFIDARTFPQKSLSRPKLKKYK